MGTILQLNATVTKTCEVCGLVEETIYENTTFDQLNRLQFNQALGGFSSYCGFPRCLDLHWVEPPTFNQRRLQEIEARQPKCITVYGLVRKSDRLLVYVGQTSKLPSARIVGHLASAKTGTTEWETWCRDNILTGVDQLEPIVLEEIPLGSTEKAKAAETKWIGDLLVAGVDLKNTMVSPGTDKPAFLKSVAAEAAA